jgi:hypothetical protein
MLNISNLVYQIQTQFLNLFVKWPSVLILANRIVNLFFDGQK